MPCKYNSLNGLVNIYKPISHFHFCHFNALYVAITGKDIASYVSIYNYTEFIFIELEEKSSLHH